MKRKKYKVEFKKQAIELAESIGSVPRAGIQLGISDDLIYSWRKAIRGNTHESDQVKIGQATLDRDEVLRLRKENAELKKVNHILKAAAAFFSQDHLK